MPKATLSVVLLRATPAPEELVATAARLCYSSADIEMLTHKAENTDNTAYIDRLMDMGHLSPIEHASFTFGVEGVSRALLAQLTRHRIASFSVKSQRYVKAGQEGFSYIIPPAIQALGEGAVKEFSAQMEQMQTWYTGWLAQLGTGEESLQDARFVLPNAAETKLIVTMNARELLHFFSLRCCQRAQWEIRQMAWEMLRLCKQVAPALFAKAGPDCLHGPCPEGIKCCGKQREVKERAANL